VSASADTTVLIWDISGLRPAAPPVVEEKLSDAQLAALWQDLSNADARKAYQAMTRLLASPAEVATMLKGQLKPINPFPVAQIEQWLQDLEGDQFAVRQKASDELSKLGRVAVPFLRKRLEGKPTLEARMRIDKLLGQVAASDFTPQTLRALRAIRVLERIGIAEARELLAAMSKGVSEAWETEAAQQALVRLNWRAGTE